MTREEFLQSADTLWSEIMVVNKEKGRDYTVNSEDALANFKVSGEDFNIEPMKVLGILMSKHDKAIYSYIKSGGQNESEPIRGRLHDSILYKFLLNALIEEQI